MPPPPSRRAITNDGGGKSRSNFPLGEPKEAFGFINSATATPSNGEGGVQEIEIIMDTNERCRDEFDKKTK